MGKILDKIAEGKVLVSDGAWGTFLHQKGLKVDECPESWNLNRSDKVLEIAKSYVEAGSDIILTNSFGGSPFKLEGYGLSKQTYEINRAAAEISKIAAGDQALVLGSIGPSGKMIFMGEISEEEFGQGIRLQAEGLAAGGVDGIVLETMSDLQEASLAIRAVKNATDLDIACTFTFSLTKNGDYRTMMGAGIDEYLQMAHESGAHIIGANCGNGTAGMIQIVKAVREIEADMPILVHANAGLPELTDGETVFPEVPSEMAEQMKELVEVGANIVGGCCGTTPDHIRMISNILN